MLGSSDPSSQKMLGLAAIQCENASARGERVENEQAAKGMPKQGLPRTIDWAAPGDLVPDSRVTKSRKAAAPPVRSSGPPACRTG